MPGVSHREELLLAAKRLLVRKGFGDITARDLVAESGTNLASIGYHFGSKDALLNAAIIDSFDDWDDQLDQAMTAPGDSPSARLATFLGALATAFRQNPEIVVASAEGVARAPHVPEVRAQLAEVYEQARSEVAALVLGDDARSLDDQTARSVGSLALALINGLALQIVIDAERAPSAAEIEAGLQALGSGRRDPA